MKNCDHCGSKNLKRTQENVERLNVEKRRKERVDVWRCDGCWKEHTTEHVPRPRGAEEQGSAGTTDGISSHTITPLERITP